IVIAAADRLQFVVSPGILLVAVPGVEEFRTHLLGHGTGIGNGGRRSRGGRAFSVLRRRGTDSDRKNQQKQSAGALAHRSDLLEIVETERLHDSSGRHWPTMRSEIDTDPGFGYKCERAKRFQRGNSQKIRLEEKAWQRKRK